jgi:hypothetical protein
MSAHVLAGRARPMPLADRMARHRNSSRLDVSWERATYDVLLRRRDTAEDPPGFQDAVARVAELHGTEDIHGLRAAAIDAAVAALAIVTRLPARDLMESLDEE